VDGVPDPSIYHLEPDSDYSIRVSQNLFMHRKYVDLVWEQLLASPLRQNHEYVYSDIGFMLLAKMVEHISGMGIDEYVQKHIYAPLNLPALQYNPLGRVNPDWIVPTEVDTYFRMELVHGTVHDPGAAMLGGVAGHAGLFGSATDVAIVMQMLLDGGIYGGKRVFVESTVDLFTKKHGKISRRGLGFDKPETDVKKPTPTSRAVSPLTFGHTGFTGTCAWADPKYNLVYVFLSNRVNPSSANKKLVDLNIRTRIMDAAWLAIKNAR
jgi:CubicO group peptidase (beta-lactamase class C family)